MSAEVISVRGLSKRFARDLQTTRRRGLSDIRQEFSPRSLRVHRDLDRDEFWSLDDVSFTLNRGDALGIVGANGAGKTTLLRILHGLSKPDRGTVDVVGMTGAVLQLGTSFDAQVTGRESIMLEGPLLGRVNNFTDEAIQRILDFADIGDFIDAPVRTYSMGMRMRLGYAITAELKPDILLLDEDLAVGDFGFQRKCVRFLQRFVAEGGTLVVVSHQIWELRSICSRCLVLDHGKVVADGDLEESIHVYMTMSEEREQERIAREAAFHLALEDSASDSGDHPPEEASPGDPSHSITILGATLKGSDDGDPTPRLPAEIEVDIEAREEVASFSWSFAFAQPSQMAVIVSGESPPQPPLDSGRHRLVASLPRWPLFPGAYELRVAIFGLDGDLIGQRGLFDQPLRVDVPLLGTKRESAERLVRVMVVADFRWQLPGSDNPVTATTAVGKK